MTSTAVSALERVEAILGNSAVYDLAEIATCRQALAATARMLQRMADRDFGRCGHCADEIPVDRLSECPEVRYCGDCEQAIPA